ncbi:MAG: response regulator [Firmicutes bacterium]|nr:response regulator [Bacillota bacterium]
MFRRLKVLVAEDESLVAMGLKSALKRLGHEVIGQAFDGLEAVEMSKRLQPELVLMDINMPKLDGIEAAKLINEHNPIPVIIISGYSQADLISRATEAGVYGYLVKPVDKTDLAPAIDVAFGRFEETLRFKRSLEERKLIERAKGVLMDKRGLRENEAMKYLERQSQNTNEKLAIVAKKILEGNDY